MKKEVGKTLLIWGLGLSLLGVSRLDVAVRGKNGIRGNVTATMTKPNVMTVENLNKDNHMISMGEAGYELNLCPRVTKEAAIMTAKLHWNRQNYLFMNIDASLTVYLRAGKNYLAWKIVFTSEEPLRQWVYYVDAHEGTVIYIHNNLRELLEQKILEAQMKTTSSRSAGTSICTPRN